MLDMDQDIVHACADLVGRTGARCKCGRLVALSDHGAVAYGSRMADGSFWSVQQAAAAGQCRWRRMGPRWVRGCE